MSAVASIYDPLGLAAPLIMTAQILLQELYIDYISDGIRKFHLVTEERGIIGYDIFPCCLSSEYEDASNLLPWERWKC